MKPLRVRQQGADLYFGSGAMPCFCDSKPLSFAQSVACQQILWDNNPPASRSPLSAVSFLLRPGELMHLPLFQPRREVCPMMHILDALATLNSSTFARVLRSPAWELDAPDRKTQPPVSIEGGLAPKTSCIGLPELHMLMRSVGYAPHVRSWTSCSMPGTDVGHRRRVAPAWKGTYRTR